MNKQTKTTLAVILATSVASFAGTKALDTSMLTPAEPSVSGSVGVSVATGYIDKGREYDTHPVVQPWLNLAIPTTVEFMGTQSTIVLSTKQNVHTESPKADWWRSEVNAGLLMKRGRVSFLPSYELVTSPNHKFSKTESLNLCLGFDDTRLTPFALNPHVKTSISLKKNGLENTGGAYYEVGIAPSVKVQTTKVTFPINLGVGANNFYAQNEHYGYTSVGVNTDTPLVKNVSLVTASTYVNTNEYSNNGKTSLWLTSAGISVKF